MKARRTCTLGRYTKPSTKGGHQERLWAFGYADMAKLFETSQDVVRAAVSRGTLDPSDLCQLIAFRDGRLK